MKAAVRSKFGSADVLRIEEIELPIPKDNELLIRVFAATVNRTDCHNLTGMPLIMRFIVGFFKPKLAVTGTDFAGQIEAIGENVRSFKVGDRVMGFEFAGLSSHAYYLKLRETKDLIIIPDKISYVDAAACVEGAFYALNCIQKMKPTTGQNALVIGATGAIGSSMVQFFKFYGASVTAVCRSEHTELVKSLGAGKVIDYKKEDFRKDNEQYDFVFDGADKSSFADCKPLLKKNGIFTTSGAPNLLMLLLTSIAGGKKVIFCPPKKPKECMRFTIKLAEEGKFIPVIDRKYPIERIAEAYTYVASGQKIGNVIIVMDDPES